MSDSCWSCTAARLDQLMEGRTGQDRIFHYLPFSFCASWIAVLTFLLRGSLVTLNTDLTKIPNDMPLLAPHYFLNVPQLLERMRRAVDEQIGKKGGSGSRRSIREPRRPGRGKKKGTHKPATHSGCGWQRLRSSPIRKKMVGENLKALICGSAPLTPETQDYFSMLGIPVLQVYGLTETTGICTMDDPHQFTWRPRWAGDSRHRDAAQ
jgi:long-chain acyl-CoA synthetase